VEGGRLERIEALCGTPTTQEEKSLLSISQCLLHARPIIFQQEETRLWVRGGRAFTTQMTLRPVGRGNKKKKEYVIFFSFSFNLKKERNMFRLMC
jgi:hypothetical protein